MRRASRPQARASDRAGAIEAQDRVKVPDPSDYDRWKNEPRRLIGRSILSALVTTTTGGLAAAALGAGGVLLGSAFGGPLIGGIVGAAFGAGIWLGYKLSEWLDAKLFGKVDQERFDRRIELRHGAHDALIALKAKSWLTKPIADGWSKLSPDRMRSLLDIDTSKVSNAMQARDLRERIILGVGRAMTATGTNVSLAYRVGLALKQELESAPPAEALGAKIIPSPE